MIRSLLLVALCSSPSGAATFEDYERARAALERQEILPLAEILARVEGEFDSRMIEVDFEAAEGWYIYEFELIDRNGQIREVTVDAATGEVIGVALEVEDDD